jgi:hypothetical protein
MPRFYFHYRTDDELIPDQLGSELPDLQAAEENAASLARAIVERVASTGEDPELPRTIEITDSDGEELLYIVFWASKSNEARKETLDASLMPHTLH